MKKHDQIYEEATQAANRAAQTWLERARVEPMDTARGSVCIQLELTNDIAKRLWLENGASSSNIIRIEHWHSSRQEVGLHKAAAEAACAVLRRYGINCRVRVITYPEPTRTLTPAP